jgi:diguanylate cyclase (GGDEF)-like protein
MSFSLRTYLFLCLGLIAVAPALLLGGLNTQRLAELQLAQSDRETSLAAEALAREVAQLMQAHTDAVKGLSRQVEARGSLEPAALQPIVTAQHSAADTLGNMWVGNRAGVSQVIDPPLGGDGKPAAGTNYSDRDYYANVLSTNATTYSRAQLGRTTQRPNMQIIEPVRDAAGQLVGMSEGAVDLAEIQTVAEQILARSPSLRAVVLDAEGRVLAHPDATARSTMQDLSQVALYRPGSDGDVELRSETDENGVSMRAVIARVPLDGLNWTVVMARTEAEVQADAAEAQRKTFIGAALALVGGLVLAAALASVFAQPITVLAAVAAAVGRGDLSTPSPRKRPWHPREVGVLLEALRDMVVQLRSRTGELEHQAQYDSLTSLPNRVLLRQQLDGALEAARRVNGILALLFVDLDRFKEVNDTLGHHVGDVVLRGVAARFVNALPSAVTVARLGGDEFAIVLQGASDHAASNAADKILRTLEEPFMVEGLPIAIGASIGIVLFPDQAQDVESLLRQADVAMYVAKAAHAGHAIYSPEQDHYRREQLALAGELRQALDRGELLLHYQPKVDLTCGRVIGVEALVRWQHPQRGLIPPDNFIPVAEQSGLIRRLTCWVLEQAVRQLGEWDRAGLDLTIAVNLSMHDLHDPQLPVAIAALLASENVASNRLKVEITESTIMADPTRALEVLAQLRSLGLEVAIDDFGTGYSSMAYLKRLPVDELKIDKSFVKNLASDHSDWAIVRSTIELGHNLGLRVVAEGVEDWACWEQLARLGCDIAQGYHMSRPLPLLELEDWLLESRPLGKAA